MSRLMTLAVTVTAAFLLSPPSAQAEKHDDLALAELVEILRAQGVLTDEQYRSVSAKAAMQDTAKQEDWTDRVEIWGDFRARYEMVDFANNTANSQRGANGDRLIDDQDRFRYRLRLNLKGRVNDHADLFVRLATGRDGRTTNETLGANVDFAPDEIFVDKAYIRASPFAEGRLPGDAGSLWFYYGRTQQPWRWDSIFKDWLLWDDELIPAGAYGDLRFQLNEQLQIFASSGLFYIDENSTSKDPKLIHAQLGLHGQLEPRFDVGGRATWYNLSSLDDGFIGRGVNLGNTLGDCRLDAMGNLVDCSSGLTGAENGSADVLEFGAYLKARLIERWPMLFFADLSTNLDASSLRVPAAGGFRTDDDDLAWLAAFQIGDAKEIVRFRVHYAYLEANSFPGQFVDSDMFDGRTNRKGWVWDLTKRIMANTDASVTAFLSDPIEESGGYANSQLGAERFRLQANLVWSF